MLYFDKWTFLDEFNRNFSSEIPRKNTHFGWVFRFFFVILGGFFYGQPWYYYWWCFYVLSLICYQSWGSGRFFYGSGSSSTSRGKNLPDPLPNQPVPVPRYWISYSRRSCSEMTPGPGRDQMHIFIFLHLYRKCLHTLKNNKNIVNIFFFNFKWPKFKKFWSGSDWNPLTGPDPT